MPLWTIQRLSREHDRASFDCGLPSLNDWLRLRAGQFDRKDLARTYVALRIGEKNVAGFYALSNHYVYYDALPEQQAKGLPRIDVPVVLLGQLAVDKTVQRQGLGSILVVNALRRVQRIADEVGVQAVEVHAIDEAARSFYLHFGFVPLKDGPFHLFLSMQFIRRLHLAPLD